MSVGAIAQKCLELSPRGSVEVTVNTILPQTLLRRSAPNGLLLADDTTNKPKANPESKRTHESAVIRYRGGFKRDCTQMVDLL